MSDYERGFKGKLHAVLKVSAMAGVPIRSQIGLNGLKMMHKLHVRYLS